MTFALLNPVHTHRGHGDDRPPVRVKHGLEGAGLLLLLKHEDETGEHDGAHPQQEEQQAQLLVVSLHSVAKSLESGGMFGWRKQCSQISNKEVQEKKLFILMRLLRKRLLKTRKDLLSVIF